MSRCRDMIAAIAAATLGLAGSAAAQGYPDHIVELVVPATPGSSADILGRVLADGMATALGQRIVVLNKVGAGGMLGTAAVAQAKPDGYTLVHTAVYALTVQPLTERQVSYTHKSFDPICQTFKNDQVIVARPNTYKNVADLHRRQQGQARRPELRHAWRRHHPVSVDRRAVADHQGRIQPRAVPRAARVDPDDRAPGRSISRWRR